MPLLARKNSPAHWIDADAYLFDIDGTLLNAYGRVHYNAFSAGLKNALNIECTIDGVPWHGNTDIGILRVVAAREGVLPKDFEQALPHILSCMCEEAERNKAAIRSAACNGIPELLKELQRRGKLLGLASGNLATIGWLKVAAAGLKDFFSFGSFSDTKELRTDIFLHGVNEARRLGARKVCMVGDTPQDILAAKANQVPIIAVATGIFTIDQLLGYNPEACVGCCSELLPLLRNAGVTNSSSSRNQ